MAKATDTISKIFFMADPKTSNEVDSTARDEYLLKIIDEVYSKENIEVKTDLNVKQINAINKGKLFADRYNCTLLDDLCQNTMILSVSKDRKGRKEFTEISKSINSPQEEELPTLGTRLLGE